MNILVGSPDTRVVRAFPLLRYRARGICRNPLLDCGLLGVYPPPQHCEPRSPSLSCCALPDLSLLSALHRNVGRNHANPCHIFGALWHGHCNGHRLVLWLAPIPHHVCVPCYTRCYPEEADPQPRSNQTTIESLSPFWLLRHIPPLPDNADSRRLSNPPLEHELSFEQRMLVRDAHRHIRLYDIGARNNWAQVFGWSRPWGWLYRLAIGGGWYVPRVHYLWAAAYIHRFAVPSPAFDIPFVSTGDGRSFPRNPRSDEMLSRLAAGLVSADKDR